MSARLTRCYRYGQAVEWFTPRQLARLELLRWLIATGRIDEGD